MYQGCYLKTPAGAFAYAGIAPSGSAMAYSLRGFEDMDGWMKRVLWKYTSAAGLAVTVLP